MSKSNGTGFLRRINSSLRWFGISDGGVAAIEFAFVAPILILGFFGAWEYSRAFATEQKVTKIAGSMADLVARTPDPNSATGSDAQMLCSDVDIWLQITDVLMAPYDPSTLSVTLFNIRAKTDNKLNVEVKWRVHNGRGVIAQDQPAMDFVTTGKLLVDKTNDEVIVAMVTYQHPFAISGLAGGDGVTKINLGENTPMKPRIGPVRLVSTKNNNVAAGNTITANTTKCTNVHQRAAAPY